VVEFNTFFTLAETACVPPVVAEGKLPRAVDRQRFESGLAHGRLNARRSVRLGRTIAFAVDAVAYAASVVSLRLPTSRFSSSAIRTISLKTSGAEIRAGQGYF
jgi:hypothetical protein